VDGGQDRCNPASTARVKQGVSTTATTFSVQPLTSFGACPAVSDAALERELVDRAKSGDVDAFERLYRLTVGRVYALCLRMTGDHGTAEDLTQEVFVRAWQKLTSFRGDSALSTWLFRLAVNAVISHRRSDGRRRRNEFLADDPGLFDGRSTVPTVGVRVDVERAVKRLPDGARSVFVLHDVEGLRHEEIGALLGIAAGTSKAQLHRARTLLREALQ
jgi:RNA polymerase sigma-70 factor (ECF subfamily)